MTGDWFLRKYADGATFGPLTFEQLVAWARAARIAPQDCVSSDQTTWLKAPMLAELEMDWLVEITSERFYGPTTIGAIHEFMRLGEITAEDFVVNTCDGSRRRVAELAHSFPQDQVTDGADESPFPAFAGMSIDFQERIRDLEQSLREERRALKEADARYRDLEERYQELLITSSAND